MSDDLIIKVAKALSGHSDTAWNELSATEKNSYIIQADRAIRAYKEYEKFMLESALES